MELQLIEVYIPNNRFDQFLIEIQDFDFIEKWHTPVSETQQLVKILIEKKNTEKILDFLEMNDRGEQEIRALLYNISTYIPRMEQDEEEEKDQDPEEKENEITRASRHELYNVVQSSSKASVNFIWMLLLSAVVATAGIVKDSAAIVIGAMVIAPLIGPFTALSFAAILGDYHLMKRSALTSLFGLAIPITIAIIFGFLFPLPLHSDEFLARTNIEFMDIVVALAAGTAGALSFAKRVSEALVGVMVSVALLPPAVVLGMMIGDFSWEAALTPFLLLMVNISAILFSAIVVFWTIGIEPNKWQKIQVANTSKTYALIAVSLVIIILAVMIYVIKF
ncbi:TIGR00341 family protein [Gracilibacillus caseinilyticus]|uniref:TIGR00341 family protein n=1 Tax=Gracilibacillus caseinilyticus TaxID=2932256 RepID=A0ABY4EQN6_9BACI|nr:TIGR00341 family protein [Gracilibacillus caseinilyticus]UOQ46763.1 TIGR00341 family protein [Gracilibacillus caseinilyticus]